MTDDDQTSAPVAEVAPRLRDMLRAVSDDDAPPPVRADALAQLGMAFSLAVRHRFGERPVAAEVARYVMGLRTELASRGVDLPPLEAEAVARGLAGDTAVLRGVSPQTQLDVVMIMTPELAAHEYPTAAETEAWLDAAAAAVVANRDVVAGAVEPLLSAGEGA